MLLVTLAFGLAAAAPVVQRPDPAIAQAQDALAAVRDAAEALGGEERLKRIRTLELSSKGQLMWPIQGYTPAETMRFDIRYRQFINWPGRTTDAIQEFAGPESTFERKAAVGHFTDSDAASRLGRQSPHAVIRELLARPGEVRLVGGNAEQIEVAGPVFGRFVNVRIDRRTKLPMGLSLFYDDPAAGDSVLAIRYGDYRRVGEWMLPQRLIETSAGRTSLDIGYEAVAFDGERPSWAAAIPAGQPGGAPSLPPRLELKPLHPGIYLAHRHGGSDYHGLVIDLPEGFMVLETPPAMGDGTELRSALRAISDKRIRYAAATHHHDDHSAGMPAAVDDGTTVLATPGNSAFFRQMLSARREFSNRRAVARRGVNVRSLLPGERIGPVQFFDVGSARHAREHLIFYFPEHRLLFQSDMGRFGEGGPPEAGRDAACALLQFIRDKGLRVDAIAGGHGGIGKLADLEQAVSRRTSPCPDFARTAGTPPQRPDKG